MTSSSFEKYATGALIGGVVGAVMGLLLAPRSGAETREIIRQEVEIKSREAAEALKEKSEVIKEKPWASRKKWWICLPSLRKKAKKLLHDFKRAIIKPRKQQLPNAFTNIPIVIEVLDDHLMWCSGNTDDGE